MTTVEWVLAQDERFRYQLLDRMRSDCEYYLNNDHISSNRLWAGSAKSQIEVMIAIWNSFPEDGKPQWLTWRQIEKLKADMDAASSREG